MQNSISWWEWGEEAFDLARSLDVPILLSISAVWCHWCHVMDQTTFADPEVAALIDAHFIPIRVDNDKRPDINARYNMGGWPTVAFLTPEGEILSGGTYMPPEAFKESLRRIHAYYHQSKAEIQSRSAQMQAQRKKAQDLALRGIGELTPSVSDRVYESVVAAYDPQYGGFGQAPKFPQVDVIEFALGRHARTGHVPTARSGGSRTAATGDCSRTTACPAEPCTERGTDASGRQPMGGRSTSGEIVAAATGGGAVEMVVKTLQAMAAGGIYDHESGGFFRYSTTRDWRIPHFEKMLEDNARLLSVYLHAYLLTGEGLFRHTAESIISYVESTLRDRDRGYFYGSQDADEKYYALKRVEREKRQAPFVDTVAYTSWNAMMASAYLEAAAILGRPELAAAALTALGFLWQNCWLPEQGLARFWDGEPHLHGLLSDQAWTAYALLHAYEYTGVLEYLQHAEEIMRWVHSALSTQAGSFQDRPDNAVARGRLAEAEVSMTENAVAAKVLIRLARLSGDDTYMDWARSTLRAFVRDYGRYGTFASGYALAIEHLLSEPLRVVVVGSAEDPQTLELLRAAWRAYAPNRVLLAVDPLWQVERLAALGYPTEPAPRAYACFGHTCAEPAAEASQVVSTIGVLLDRDEE